MEPLRLKRGPRAKHSVTLLCGQRWNRQSEENEQLRFFTFPPNLLSYPCRLYVRLLEGSLELLGWKDVCDSGYLLVTRFVLTWTWCASLGARISYQAFQIGAAVLVPMHSVAFSCLRLYVDTEISGKRAKVV